MIMRNYRKKPLYKIVSLLLILSILHLTVSCKYFKVKETAPSELKEVADIGEQYNYFVLHHHNRMVSLKQIELDSTSISGTISKLDSTVWYEKGRTTRIKSNEKSIVHEVHIYLNENYDTLKAGAKQSIPLEYLEEIQVIDPDTGATVASYFLGTLGVIAGAFAILLVIVAATKSSCPYVFSYNGETFLFEGEIFGGAIMQNLQREDYIPLPGLKIENNQVRVRINNELKEKHFVDVANLLMVSHPMGTRVLIDSNGKPRIISNTVQPTEAYTLKGNEVLNPLLEKDNNCILFNEENENTNAVILKFSNENPMEKSRLMLTAKNTLWLDYIFTKFTEKLGGFFDLWMKEQAELTAQQRMQRTIEEGFPLTVSVLKKGKWQIIEHIPTVGPLAMRDFVIPVNTKELGKEILIKIETGFLYWELDYAAMDFTPQSNINLKRIKATEVYSSDQLNWKKALSRVDGKYMEQPAPGMIAEMTFAVEPGKTELQQSFFLHTSGYYELIRNYRGLPRLKELKKFKQVGYFPEYSRLLYNSIQQEKLSLARGNN